MLRGRRLTIDPSQLFSSSHCAQAHARIGLKRHLSFFTPTAQMRPAAIVGVGLLHLTASAALYAPCTARGARPAWAVMPPSWSRTYHGCRSLSASVDSSRAGYFKTYEGLGAPEVDPVLRSEVRERLRAKRREPFSKEMGQEILARMQSEGGLIPMRVIVEVSLRRTLKLTRREKKARLFFPPEVTSDFGLFLNMVYEAFPVAGFPHTLVARVRQTEEEDGPSTEFVISGQEDLRRALQASEEAGHPVQLVIKGDEAAAAAMVPSYMVGMPDPRDAPTMQMLSFYKFFTHNKDQDGLAHMAKRLRALWEPFGALGRIYVAEEGMNAQMAVPSNVVTHFEAACRSLPELEKVFLNFDRQQPMSDYLSDPGFDALHIRVRNQVVADGGLDKAYDWQDCGKPMAPEEWHNKVDDPNVLVFDCRNEFESEVGRFTSAEPLNTSFFRESWDVLRDRLADVPKDTEILTYCTGGIRCIKVGAWLKQELGFSNVARLEGGIISYARHLREKAAAETAEETEKPEEKPELVAVSPQPPAIPFSKFKGLNYVFDNRLGERITADVLSRCDQCGTPCDEFVNCANHACHVRFLQCPKCNAAFQGCCSRGCAHTAEEMKLRPAPGGYPAPPPKIWYPEDDVDTAPVTASVTATMEGGMRSGGGRRGRKRAWLHPGAFQNVRLNMAFDQLVDIAQDADDTQESPALASVRSATEAAFPEGAHMVSGHTQGRLFANLARLLGATSVLEIGTFTGYSALCFAEGLPESGRVVTCEVDERAAAIASKAFASSPHGHKVELRLGPAMDVIDSYAALPLEERPQFDLIFIDGDKKRYTDYYEAVLKHGLLSRKGLIIADNVLWKGLVPKLARQLLQGGPPTLCPDEYEPLGYTKRQVQLAEVMHSFNMHVRADPRTEQAVLNLRDGLLFVRLKGAERTRIGEAQAQPQAQPAQLS